MRKIEEKMIRAIRDVVCFNEANTRVESYVNGKIEVYLHGNLIAMFERVKGSQNVTIYDGGWKSNTTKSRLNVILTSLVPGWGISQSKKQWYIRNVRNGDEYKWNGKATFDSNAVLIMHR